MIEALMEGGKMGITIIDSNFLGFCFFSSLGRFHRWGKNQKLQNIFKRSSSVFFQIIPIFSAVVLFNYP